MAFERLISGIQNKYQCTEDSAMVGQKRTYYPFIWFTRGGWWFKAFDEYFGPYPRLIDAQYNLLVLERLSHQLKEEVHSHSRPS